MLSKSTMKELEKGFENYTKAEMEGALKKHGLSFLALFEEELNKAGLRPQFAALVRSKRVLRKNDLIQLSSLPFSIKYHYNLWRASLEEDVRTVWDLMIWETALTEDEVFEKTGIRISEEDRKKNSYYRNSNQRKIIPKFSLFKTYNAGSWHAPKVGIGIPLPLRLFLVKYYDLPEKAELKVEDEIEKTDFLFEKSDELLFSEISGLYLYHSQKNIALTSKDRPKHTTIPKMQKTLNLREFFQNNADKKLRVLRTNMLAGLFAQMGHRIKMDDPLTYLKKGLFENSFLKSAATPALILTDLKGMGYLSDHDFYAVEQPLVKKLKDLPEGWISVDRIELNLKYHLLPGRIMGEYVATDKLYYEYAKTQEFNGKQFIRKGKQYLERERQEKSISKPYIRGFFFMLSALGICDLAYNRPDRETVGLTCQSAYDELKYIRLTPLGLYLLGKADSYKMPEDLGETKFVFSPSALTITLDGKDVSAGFVLEPYAVKVGPNRFATETQTFLKGIKSKKELTQKISMFRQVTKVEMPQNWEDFFKDMQEKVDPFEPIEEALHVYKLPESNKSLIKLIAQDKYLRGYSMKAEGYHVLVPKSKNAAFKKRLLEFGYLVT